MARRNPSNIIPVTRRCRRSAHEDVALRTVTWLLINRIRLGLAWRATEQDFETASAFGVNIDRGVASNFFLSSAVVGAILGAISTRLHDDSLAITTIGINFAS